MNSVYCIAVRIKEILLGNRAQTYAPEMNMLCCRMAERLPEPFTTTGRQLSIIRDD
jgi:hypothetical protein